MGDFFGMLCYMVLECFCGEVDYCCDIYVFGLIFYELFVGWFVFFEKDCFKFVNVI